MRGPVLVPLDGSPLAEEVLPLAARLASGRGVPLFLLRVLTPIPLPSAPIGFVAPYLVPTTTSEDLVRLHAEDREEAMAYLESVATRLRSADLRVDCVVDGDGDPSQRIVARANEIGAWLIAMSTHGRSGLRRWLFGSVAESTLRRATVPVLLIRPAAEAPTTPVDRPSTVLVPLDGSPAAERALMPAAEVARALRVPIQLLRVVSPVEQPLTGPMTSLLRVALPIVEEPVDREIDAQRYLERIARQLRRRCHTIQWEVIAGPPAEEIVAAARRFGSGVIVMAMLSRANERSPLGDVAQRVHHDSGLPTVLVPSATGRRLRPPTGRSPQSGSR